VLHLILGFNKQSPGLYAALDTASGGGADLLVLLADLIGEVLQRVFVTGGFQFLFDVVSDRFDRLRWRRRDGPDRARL